MNDLTDAKFITSALHWSARVEASTRGFAWIDPWPAWETCADWLDAVGLLMRKPTDGKPWHAVLRLRLPGGDPRDEVRLQVSYPGARKSCNVPAGLAEGADALRCTLRVTEFGDSVARRYHSGEARDLGTEMHRHFIAGMPSEVGQRVAALVREIGVRAPEYLELLEGDSLAVLDLLAALQPYRADRLRCVACERPLADEVSKALGIGPDCARAAGIPHNLASAGRVAGGAR